MKPINVIISIVATLLLMAVVAMVIGMNTGHEVFLSISRYAFAASMIVAFLPLIAAVIFICCAKVIKGIGTLKRINK